jgi:hypothetical protein
MVHYFVSSVVDGIQKICINSFIAQYSVIWSTFDEETKYVELAIDDVSRENQ